MGQGAALPKACDDELPARRHRRILAALLLVLANKPSLAKHENLFYSNSIH